MKELTWDDIARLPETLRLALLVRLREHLAPSRLATMEDGLSRRHARLTVIAEDLYQEQNASALIRSCDCFGVQKMHVIERKYSFRPDAEIAMAAQKWVQLHQYGADWAACAAALRAEGFALCAMTLRPGAQPLDELVLDQPVALMFGTELSGLSEEAHALADRMVYIPTIGYTQSLNVSVSAGIALHEISRRLRRAGQIGDLSPQQQDLARLYWICQSLGDSGPYLRRYNQELNLEAYL